MKAAEVIMNPVRQRILQCILLNGSATVSTIAENLTDIPKPSIYRHIKILLDNGYILVTDETAKRGTIEKTYSIAKQAAKGNEDISAIIQGALFSVVSRFAEYFKADDPQPEKDLLTVGASTLMLSDEEMIKFMTDIGGLISKALENKAADSRKPRSIMLISAPPDKSADK